MQPVQHCYQLLLLSLAISRKLPGTTTATAPSGSLLSDLLVLFSAPPGGHGGRGQGHPGRHVQTVQEPQHHLQYGQQAAGQEPQAVGYHEGGEQTTPVGAGGTRNNVWEDAELQPAVSVGPREDGAAGGPGKEAGGQPHPPGHQEQLQGPHLPGGSEVRTTLV